MHERLPASPAPGLDPSLRRAGSVARRNISRPMPQQTATAPHEQTAAWAKVIDHTRCIGCHACSTACKSENEVPLGVNRTYVKYVDVGIFPKARRAFQVTRCNQCEDPPCARACPTAAMHQRPDGIVDAGPCVSGQRVGAEGPGSRGGDPGEIRAQIEVSSRERRGFRASSSVCPRSLRSVNDPQGGWGFGEGQVAPRASASIFAC